MTALNLFLTNISPFPFPDSIHPLQRRSLPVHNLRSQSSTTDPNDPLAKLLADLNLDELGLGGEGDGENGGDIQKMLEGMMAQLMSKDILYDPLKELDSKVRSDHLLSSHKNGPRASTESNYFPFLPTFVHSTQHSSKTTPRNSLPMISQSIRNKRQKYMRSYPRLTRQDTLTMI